MNETIGNNSDGNGLKEKSVSQIKRNVFKQQTRPFRRKNLT